MFDLPFLGDKIIIIFIEYLFISNTKHLLRENNYDNDESNSIGINLFNSAYYDSPFFIN